MKRILVLALGVLMFAGGVNASCLKTGIQLDVTSAVDTVYFDDNVGSATLRFAANYLWIHLGEDATGPVTIQRGVRTSATTVKFIDDAITIQPGGSFNSKDENVYCFKATKTGATDKLYSSASTCEQSNIDNWFNSIETLLDAPPPVSVEWNTLVQGVTLRDSTGFWWIGARTYPPTAGACVDGAKAILLEFSWTTWKSGGYNGFTLWNIFSPTQNDSTCVTGFSNTSFVDSMCCADTTASVWKGQDLKNVGGTATILIPVPAGAGHHFIRMKPHSIYVHIYGLSIRSRIVW